MQHMTTIVATIVLAAAMVACSNGGVEQSAATEETPVSTSPPTVTFTPSGKGVESGKPSGPITVSYRIIGKPVVGQPVAVDVQVMSTLEPQPINVEYRINDASAMQLAKSQPALVTLSPTVDRPTSSRQVTIIPLREGRLFLNVSASVETESGSMSTVTAIPIQVGDAPREMQENGVLETDENGEAVRSLPAKED